MDIVHIISKIKEEHILMNEHFADNKLGWEIVDSKTEHSEIINGAYHLENKTEGSWNYYYLPNVFDKKHDFLISAKFRITEPGLMGNFGIVWGHVENPKMLNRFVFNSKHGYCAAVAFERDEESSIYFRSSKKIPATIKSDGKEHRITIIKLGGFYYFFVGNTHSPVLIEKESNYILQGTCAGFYTEPGMKVEVTHFFSKKLITETVNEGTFSLILGDVRDELKKQEEKDKEIIIEDFVYELNKMFLLILNRKADVNHDKSIRKAMKVIANNMQQSGIDFVFLDETYALCETTSFQNIMRAHRHVADICERKREAIEKQDFETAATLRMKEQEVMSDVDFCFKKLDSELIFFEKKGEEEISIKQFTEPVLNKLIKAMITPTIGAYSPFERAPSFFISQISFSIVDFETLTRRFSISL